MSATRQPCDLARRQNHAAGQRASWADPDIRARRLASRRRIVAGPDRCEKALALALAMAQWRARMLAAGFTEAEFRSALLRAITRTVGGDA